MLNKYGITFRWDFPVVLDSIIYYKQNTVKHISIDDFIMCISYIVYMKDMFRL
jgi:hypothetical protein